MTLWAHGTGLVIDQTQWLSISLCQTSHSVLASYCNYSCQPHLTGLKMILRLLMYAGQWTRDKPFNTGRQHMLGTCRELGLKMGTLVPEVFLLFTVYGHVPGFVSAWHPLYSLSLCCLEMATSSQIYKMCINSLMCVCVWLCRLWPTWQKWRGSQPLCHNQVSTNPCNGRSPQVLIVMSTQRKLNAHIDNVRQSELRVHS